MALLILGVLLFSLVHLVPALTPGIKANALSKVGENGYKGLFSLLLLASFALIIIGWRIAQPSQIYLPPISLHKFALLLLGVAFLLMVTSTRNSRIKLWIRHPQLTAVALWGISHLLLNGDSRALALFGGMTLWSVIEIIAISKREGEWIKGARPSWGAEAVTVAIAAVTIAVIVYIHPWLSGMPVYW